MNEYIFDSTLKIKYLFSKNESSENLIVVFSGYSSDPILKAKYNYIKAINDINCNKLFILDNYGYDERGCWYLGEQLNFKVEKSVVDLIRYIQNECSIGNENVILLGTSKGGFASVYFGMKYGYGHIIAGAPQILLYNHIKNYPNIRDNMLPIITDANINKLNNIILELDRKNINNFYLICGTKDSHLKNHVVPLVSKLLNENNLYVELIDGNHGAIADYFNENLGFLINNIINKNIKFKTSQELYDMLKDFNIKI